MEKKIVKPESFKIEKSVSKKKEETIVSFGAGSIKYF
jgi:hypothetical protein